MLKIIETKSGKELGNKDPKHRYSLISCPECGNKRWVRSGRVYRISGLCGSCRQKGERNIKWQGGRKTDKAGYVLVKLESDDFFYPMADMRGYVREHRLVMARHLGRCLHSWEIVHHRNNNKGGNTVTNLRLATEDGHNIITIQANRIKYLEKKIAELNKLLRKQP